jgi:hypothetical protein
MFRLIFANLNGGVANLICSSKRKCAAEVARERKVSDFEEIGQNHVL